MAKYYFDGDEVFKFNSLSFKRLLAEKQNLLLGMSSYIKEIFPLDNYHNNYCYLRDEINAAITNFLWTIYVKTQQTLPTFYNVYKENNAVILFYYKLNDRQDITLTFNVKTLCFLMIYWEEERQVRNLDYYFTEKNIKKYDEEFFSFMNFVCDVLDQRN